MLTPSIREDLQLFDGTPLEDGSPSWLLFDTLTNKYFTIGLNAFRLLNYWKADVDTKTFLQNVEQKGVNLKEEELNDFISFLKVNDLVCHQNSEDINFLIEKYKNQQKHFLLKLIHNYLFFKIPLLKPDFFLDKTLSIVKLFGSKLLRNIIYILGFIGIILVIQNWDQFINTFLYFFNWNGIFFYALSLIVVKAIHEFGHAYVAKNYGCNVNSMGIAFLVFFPFLYTDNTNAWRLREYSNRLRINFAGISTELHLALIATFFWSILDPGTLKSIAFFIATTSWVSSLLINISPFMRFDGYYVLSDFLRIENLQPRAFSLAKWKLRQIIFGFKHQQPEEMNVNKRNFLIFYAWSTWIYRFFLFIGIALLVYHHAFKVLGIILFVVEILWFIALPIYREMLLWWKMRSEIGLSFNFIRTLLFILIIGTLFFYPWKNYQKIPAILQSENFISIYAPEEAQIKKIHTNEGMKVQENQILMELSSPSLSFKINQTIGELSLAKIKINNALQSKANRQQLLSLRSEKNKLETEIVNYEKIKSSLVIKAPFNSEIAYLPKFKEGQWINQKEPLVSLVDKKTKIIIAFISEKNIAKLDPSKDIFFISSHIDSPKIKLSISSISKSPVTNFNLFPIVTSLYGGPIAARENANVDILSEQAYYIITMNAFNNIDMIDQKMLGSVNIAISPTSFAEQIYKFVYATLIKELSF